MHCRFLVLGLLLCAFSAHAAPWQQVGSAQLGFTVSMPGAPEEEKETETVDGEELTTYSLTVEAAPRVYTVSYSEIGLSASVAPAQTLLDEFASGLREGKTKPLGERKVDVSGHPGRIISFKSAENLVFRVKACVAGRRLYYALAATPEADFKAAGPDFDKFLNSLAVSHKPPVVAATWQKFSHEPGRFSVLFPAEPWHEEEKETDDTPASHYFSAPVPHIEYAVSYSEFSPEEMADPKETLRLFQSGMLAGAKPLSDVERALGEWPGREFAFVDKRGIKHFIRLVAAQNRIYTVMALVATEREAGATADIAKFLDSFALSIAKVEKA